MNRVKWNEGIPRREISYLGTYYDGQKFFRKAGRDWEVGFWELSYEKDGWWMTFDTPDAREESPMNVTKYTKHDFDKLFQRHI